MKVVVKVPHNEHPEVKLRNEKITESFFGILNTMLPEKVSVQSSSTEMTAFLDVDLPNKSTLEDVDKYLKDFEKELNKKWDFSKIEYSLILNK